MDIPLNDWYHSNESLVEEGSCEDLRCLQFPQERVYIRGRLPEARKRGSQGSSIYCSKVETNSRKRAALVWDSILNSGLAFIFCLPLCACTLLKTPKEAVVESDL